MTVTETPVPPGPAQTVAAYRRMTEHLTAALAHMPEAEQYPNLQELIDEALSRGVGPVRALISAGVPESLVERAVWRHRGFPYVNVTAGGVPHHLLDRLPLPVCQAHCVVPYRQEGDEVAVAVTDPTNISVLDEVRGRFGPGTRFVVADADNIRRVLQSLEARSSTEGIELEDVAAERSRFFDLDQLDDADGRIAQLVSGLVVQASAAKASDIHIEPSDQGMAVRFRVDGVLHHMMTHPVSLTPGVVNRLKVMANLDVADRRRPQDGRFGVVVGDSRLDLRLVTVPTIWEMEGAVVRILDRSQQITHLDGLGFSPWVLDAYHKLCQFRHGSVLATGPTGSGKTTTLYATLDRIATAEAKVLTVEDPVEIRFPDVTQVQVNPKAGLTFATALRSFLRADPDILLVGEIRDLETALVSIEAALTGHLVLASLHANSAPAAATRLLEMGIDAYLVASSLRGAVSQRLLRRLCRQCRVAEPFKPAMFDHLTHLEPMPARVYRAREGGCASCGGIGFSGRTAVAEVVFVDDDMSAAIAQSRTGRDLVDMAVAGGMLPMRDDGLVKVMQGETSITEVARVVN